MNLLNDFFKILSVEKTDSKYTVAIELNPSHEIFRGHFPGNPVVPGVCMVQMVKEILQDIFKKEFTMTQASQLKFLAILNPVQVSSLNVELTLIKEEANTLAIAGSFQKEATVFLKFKATFASSPLEIVWLLCIGLCRTQHHTARLKNSIAA